MLLALRSVDYVVVFDEDEPRDLIAAIRPQVLVKGSDWAHYVSGRGGAASRPTAAGWCWPKWSRAGRTTSTIERVLAAYGGSE